MRRLGKMIIIFIAVLCTIPLTTKNIQASEKRSNIFPTVMGMKGRVTTSNVNVRKGPDLYSKTIGKLSNEDIMVTGKYNDWYRIQYSGKEAWMHKGYVFVHDARLIPEIPLMGEQVVEYAKKFIGTPYVWGGTNLNKGVDCSGFIQGVYKRFDIKLNRTSYMQALNGRTVSKNELRTGDLVFFDTTGVNRGQISHVGVYIGDGEFLHSDMTRGVSIAKLDNSYYKRNYVKGVRVIGM